MIEINYTIVLPKDSSHSFLLTGKCQCSNTLCTCPKREVPYEFLSKKFYYDAMEIMTLKQKFVIPVLSYLFPYFLRYILWTLWTSCYLSVALIMAHIWNVMSRLSPLWMEARMYQLKVHSRIKRRNSKINNKSIGTSAM
jgi:hypothetical protein